MLVPVPGSRYNGKVRDFMILSDRIESNRAVIARRESNRIRHIAYRKMQYETARYHHLKCNCTICRDVFYLDGVQ